MRRQCVGQAAWRTPDKAGWKPFGAEAPTPQGKSALQKWLARVWWYIRQVSGDAAYENYLRAQQRLDAAYSACADNVPGTRSARPGATCADGHAQQHDGAAPLSAREFYDDALRRRYSGVSRCC